MNILVVNSCLRRNFPIKQLPVGLAAIMTFIRQHGYEFDFLDLDINDYDDDYVENYLRENQYDVILYGTLVTHYKWTKWFSHTIKKHQPNAIQIVGNSVASSCPDVFLQNTPADFAVLGEGEYTAVALLDALRDGEDPTQLAGLAYRTDDGKIISNPRRPACDINSLPIPDWTPFDVERYKETSRKASMGSDSDEPVTFPVSTARGCAFRCTFCHFAFWHDPYRYRRADLIVDEVEYVIREYGANYINFFDDLSFASLPQVEKVCDEILKRGVEFQWSASIRSDLFGNERRSYEKRLRVAQKMKDAGCTGVGFSLESGSQEILDMMNKRVKVEYFEEQIKMCRKVGLSVYTAVVFGYPIETPETIKATFDMCKELEVYPSIGFLMPLPATGMYQYAIDNGFITDEDKYLEGITERQDIGLNMTSMTDDELIECIKDGAREINKLLNLGLDEDSYVKTGGYKRQTNLENEQEIGDQLREEDRLRVLDPDNMERTENDVNFNYAQAGFDPVRSA
jgi:anaerobic magnesium-protoporphyrin IX monomethyl ester cyclase